MALEFYSLNGKNPNIDYNEFENSFKKVLSTTCKNAKLFILNKFPSPQSEIFDVLILFSVKPDDSYDYYYIRNKTFFNIIMPVKFINDTYELDAKIEDDELLIEDVLVDYSSEILTIKKELTSYFETRLKFDKVIINPLIFIRNKLNIVYKDYLLSEKFDFYALDRYFYNTNNQVFNSYNNWKKNQKFYDVMLTDISEILRKASEDSSTGYITLNKLNRLSSQVSRAKSIYESLGSKLFIINGKPGTGKTSELLYVLTRNYIEKRSTLLLSYNRLLLNDFSKTFNAFQASKLSVIEKASSEYHYSNESENNFGQVSINSFHQFFYKIAKSLGVLSLMTETRLDELKVKLDDRVDQITSFLKSFNIVPNIDELKKKCIIEFKNNQGLRKEALDFLNFFKLSSAKNINVAELINSENINKYITFKKKSIEKFLNKNVFLIDYPGVLKNTYKAINNFEEYFNHFDIENKYNVLENVWLLNNKKEFLNNKTISLEFATKSFNRRVGQYGKWQSILIDEAQDCYEIEKEVLYALFDTNSFVIVDGGSEQLIRKQKACRWDRKGNRRIEYIKSTPRLKSTRQKKNLVKFLNFIAQKFNVPFEMVYDDLEDGGNLIFDFRTSVSDNAIIEQTEKLVNYGKINSCTPYESLLLLCDARVNHISSASANENIDNDTYVDEDDVIIIRHTNKNTWRPLENLTNHFSEMITIWDGTVNDKKKKPLPMSTNIRLLYYESCRGVEAWSVMCFSLDVLFEIKYHDNEADKFISDDDKGLFDEILDENQRRERFAANWLIMALSRAIDTAYIQVDGIYPNFKENQTLKTRLPEILKEYASINPDVTVII